MSRLLAHSISIGVCFRDISQSEGGILNEQQLSMFDRSTQYVEQYKMLQPGMEEETKLFEERVGEHLKKVSKQIKNANKAIKERHYASMDYEKYQQEARKLADKPELSLKEHKRKFEVQKRLDEAKLKYDLLNNKLKMELPLFMLIIKQIMSQVFVMTYFATFTTFHNLYGTCASLSSEFKIDLEALQYDTDMENMRRSFAAAQEHAVDSIEQLSVVNFHQISLNKLQMKVLETTAPTETCVAMFSFDASQPDDLSFREGDRIKILDRSNPGWWRGMKLSDGTTAWAVVHFVPVREVVHQRQNPHSARDHDRVVHGILLDLLSGREHAQDDDERSPGAGYPADELRVEVAQVERPRPEQVFSARELQENGHAPRQIISCHAERKQSIRGGGAGQTQAADEPADERRKHHCSDRHLELPVHHLDDACEWQAVVPGKSPDLPREGRQDGGAHEPLADGHERHERDGPPASERVVDDLGHREARVGREHGLDVLAHTGRQTDDDEPAHDAAHADRAHDPDRHSVRGVSGLLGHVDAGVERTDGPDGRHEGETELPPDRPIRVVLHGAEDELAVVEARVDRRSDRERNQKQHDDARVAHHRRGLQPRDVLRAKAGAQGLCEDACSKNAVCFSCGYLEISIFRKVHCCQDFLCVSVPDTHEPGAEGKRVRQANQVRERDLDAFWRIVVRPEVEPAARGDGRRQLAHRHSKQEDEHRRDQPGPQKTAGSCGEPRARDRRDRR
ncbi:hypothetical protein KL944_000686 [Ogataea haglerorum]|nr:hypothetical protein KL944_000686 [Ogataea haglerorum]